MVGQSVAGIMLLLLPYALVETPLMVISDSVFFTLIIFFLVVLLLFLWLLYDSRKEARDDKARMREREDKLMAALQTHGELINIVRAMQAEMKEMNNALSLLVQQRSVK